MDLDPVRVVVKHTFLEFECNGGQNSRISVPLQRTRRGSDSKIEYGLSVADDAALPRAQFALAGSSAATQPGASESPLEDTAADAAVPAAEDTVVDAAAPVAEEEPVRGNGEDDVEQDTRASSQCSLNDEEDREAEGYTGILSRRGSALSSSLTGSRRNSFSKDDEGITMSPRAGALGLVGDLIDDPHPDERRRGSAFSVVTDPGDFFPPSMSMCSPWPRQEPPAHMPLTPAPTMAAPSAAGMAGALQVPQYVGSATLAATGTMSASGRTAEPPAAYPCSGAFSVGFPSLQAPPGLADDSRSRSYAQQPVQAQVPGLQRQPLQPPHHPPPQQPPRQQPPQQPQRQLPPQQPPQHAAAAGLGAAAAGAVAAATAMQAAAAAVAGAAYGGVATAAGPIPGRGPCYATGGMPGAAWPPGYFGPVGWQQPTQPAASVQRMEAGCRGNGLGLRGGYPEQVYGNTAGPLTPMPLQAAQANVRTTVMLRNLPEGFSRSMLLRMLDEAGFVGLYDFVYMPMNFRTKISFGYAFVNMVSPNVARYCHDHFQGFRSWGVPTEKVCEVSWSDMHQGLTAHIHRYRNSPVMHESVPDEYKPVMYSRGMRVPFPPPTKKLRVPRIRRSPDGFGDELDEDGT